MFWSNENKSLHGSWWEFVWWFSVLSCSCQTKTKSSSINSRKWILFELDWRRISAWESLSYYMYKYRKSYFKITLSFCSKIICTFFGADITSRITKLKAWLHPKCQLRLINEVKSSWTMISTLTYIRITEVDICMRNIIKWNQLSTLINPNLLFNNKCIEDSHEYFIPCGHVNKGQCQPSLAWKSEGVVQIKLHSFTKSWLTVLDQDLKDAITRRNLTQTNGQLA